MRSICSWFIGSVSGEPSVNASEIQAWRWITPAALQDELTAQPNQFTPWFKMEWQHLLDHHADLLPPA